jgi:hypothetical protein
MTQIVKANNRLGSVNSRFWRQFNSGRHNDKTDEL